MWRLLSSLLLHGTGICHHAFVKIFGLSFVVVSVHSFSSFFFSLFFFFFFSFLFFFFFFFSFCFLFCCFVCLLILLPISYTELSTIPACASLMYSF